MKKNRYIIYKTITIAAAIAVTLYLSYSTILSFTIDINLCCNSSFENKENPHTAPCCTDDESDSDCCYIEIPPQNETLLFLELIQKKSYHSNIFDLKEYFSDSFILEELYDIICEECLFSKDVIYFIFRPPKV